MTYAATATVIAGILAIAICLYSIVTMGKGSIWPTIALGLIGLALIFEGLTLSIVKAFGG